MSVHLYVALFFWTLIAAGVGLHATNRGRSGFLWAAVAFVTGLVGVLIYAVVLLSADSDDEPEEQRVCPNCSARHAGSPDYCSDCGEALGEADDRPSARVLKSGADGYCSNCKSKVELDDESCANCGAVF